jgi:hypothetical protein
MSSIVFVHGLGNKPEANELLRIWQRSLGRENGIDLSAEGVESFMVYWADVFYPLPDTDIESYESTEDVCLNTELEEITSNSELHVVNKLSITERIFLDGLAKKYGINVTEVNSRIDKRIFGKSAVEVFERIPVPAFLKERIMAWLVKEAYAYIFNKESSPVVGKIYDVRTELRERFISTLKTVRASKPDEPLVVIAHSMGTMIAYDCLKCVPDCPKIDWLLTVGSPLGIDEIQDGFSPLWTSDNGYPSEKLLRGWINIFDPLDIVARLDPYLANDYLQASHPVIRDIVESNWGVSRHSISKYLQGKELRRAVRQALGV